MNNSVKNWVMEEGWNNAVISSDQQIFAETAGNHKIRQSF